MKCCLCGDWVDNVKWAIRDYINESYCQWVGRHIETILKMRSHKEDGSLPVCIKCYLKAESDTVVRGYER